MESACIIFCDAQGGKSWSAMVVLVAELPEQRNAAGPGGNAQTQRRALVHALLLFSSLSSMSASASLVLSNEVLRTLIFSYSGVEFLKTTAVVLNKQCFQSAVNILWRIVNLAVLDSPWHPCVRLRPLWAIMTDHDSQERTFIALPFAKLPLSSNVSPISPLSSTSRHEDP